MARDRAELRKWYQDAMLRRAEELRTLRPALASGDEAACVSAREISQALRGSGATFGFPELSTVAALVETSADIDVPRRVEGLMTELQALTQAEGGERRPSVEWLTQIAGIVGDSLSPAERTDDAAVWRAIGRKARVEGSQLAAMVGEAYGLEVADLAHRSSAALRLVPAELVARARIVPLREDSVSITVATADPTSLATEIELERLTGRRPVFEVAPPDAIEAVLSEVLADPVFVSPRAGMPGPQPTTEKPAIEPSDSPEASPERPSATSPERPRSTSPKQPRSTSPEQPPEVADGAICVLVVDDDPSARLLVRSLLEKRKYRVVEAGDGLEALDVMKGNEPIRLVVADLNMPRMDGLELMWELRDVHDWEHVPVIVVTGETDEVLETQLMEEGADDYIRKPVDPRLFLARVEATIRRSAG